MDAFAQVAGAPLGGGTGSIDMSVYGLFMQADWVVKLIDVYPDQEASAFQPVNTPA